MEDVKVCRICLVMGVKMYNLHSYPLYEYFESLIGINPLSMMHLPPYGCYECTALVKKLYYFRERCLIGQTELYAMLQATGKITAEALSNIDREQLKLTSNIAVHHTNNIISHVYDDVDYETVKVKEESPKETPKNDDYLIEVDCIKQEDYDDFLSGNMSSDDEPLALRKSQKEKKKTEKKKEKRGRKKKVEEVSLDCNGEMQAIEIMRLSEKEKSRRYRERLKADPEKMAERKRKKRGSYHKNKKLISSMLPEEQKNSRIIWKLRKQEQRKRLKAVRNTLQDTPPSTPCILQDINIPQDQHVQSATKI